MSTAYELACEAYAAEGIDTEAVLAKLAGKAISVNCWQGDDVMGFDQKDGRALPAASMTTGNYPGRARTFEELTADFDEGRAASCPGKKRINLHASYAIFDARRAPGRPRPDRAQALRARGSPSPRSTAAASTSTPRCFSHPMVKDGLTLSSPDEDVRDFWVRHWHCLPRASAEYIARGARRPRCSCNVWIPRRPEGRARPTASARASA